MRLLRPLAICLTLAAALILAASAAAASKPKTRYYLSLGDSLSVGVQPGPATNPGQQKQSVITDDGYTEQLFVKARRLYPGLVMEKLGCGGATTQNFIRGGINVTGRRGCGPAGNQPYKSTSRSTSQLTYVEHFIRAHPGQIALVTVSIGNNNLDACAPGGQIDAQCLTTGTAQLKRDLPYIGKRLRKAVGPRTPIVAATFYDPFLQLWLTGGSGQSVAQASAALAQSINEQTVIPAWAKAHVRVARVDESFGTYAPFSQTVDSADLGMVPIAVFNICKYTWMCTPAPAGPNIHANKTGYALMAAAFFEQLR
jgi:lysophospholipase L1-like esterase